MHDLRQNISTFMDYNHLISEVYVASVVGPTYDLIWWAQPKEVLPLIWLPYGGVVRGKLYTNSTFSSPSPSKEVRKILIGTWFNRLELFIISHSTIMVSIIVIRSSPITCTEIDDRSLVDENSDLHNGCLIPTDTTLTRSVFAFIVSNQKFIYQLMLPKASVGRPNAGT